MAIIKFINFGDHKGYNSLINVINYVRKYDAIGYNVFAENAVREFQGVQNYYGYDNEHNMSVVHLTVSPSLYDYIDYSLDDYETEVLAFFERHQVICSHDYKHKNRHLHFAVNPVSFFDGGLITLEHEAALREFVYRGLKRLG